MVRPDERVTMMLDSTTPDSRKPAEGEKVVAGTKLRRVEFAVTAEVDE